MDSDDETLFDSRDSRLLRSRILCSIAASCAFLGRVPVDDPRRSHIFRLTSFSVGFMVTEERSGEHWRKLGAKTHSTLTRQGDSEVLWSWIGLHKYAAASSPEIATLQGSSNQIRLLVSSGKPANFRSFQMFLTCPRIIEISNIYHN